MKHNKKKKNKILKSQIIKMMSLKEDNSNLRQKKNYKGNYENLINFQLYQFRSRIKKESIRENAT